MINIIAAITDNNALGKDNKLLFRLKKDMTHFKNITTDNVVIMGRKTYESIGKTLPNRVNIVLSRNMKSNEDFYTFDSIEKAIEWSKENYPQKEIFIIGGASVYDKALKDDIVDKLYMTKIKQTVEDADAFFPEIDYKRKWSITSVERFFENGIEFFIYEAEKKDKVFSFQKNK